MSQPMQTGSQDPLAKLRHDLRTPINHIVGYAELLEEDLVDSASNSQMEDLRKITGAARKLLQMVSDHLNSESLHRLLEGEEILLPATPVPGPDSENSAAFPSDEEESPIKGHILVVDDNESNRLMLARRLVRQGHTVSTASDGAEALRELRDANYDLVLLDVMMPGIDGYTVLHEINQDAKLRHIPVIMISALDEMDSVVRCIKSGAQDYLGKPFNPTLLKARIGASLEKKALRDLEQRHLKTIEETQARLREELDEAAHYVESILPPPLREPFPIEWAYQPSTELGGDSFGYHWIDDDHFAVYLLDVCGHGVGAALLSVSVINVLRSGSLPDTDFRDPAAVISALNEAFPMEKQNNMYFTMWYGVYRPSDRVLSHSSGGHPPALLFSRNEEKEMAVHELRAPGMVIGVMPGAAYHTEVTPIPRDSRLLILSDGTYEIKHPNGEMIAFEDFKNALLHGCGQSPAAVLQWAKNLHGEGPLADDFSLVMMDFPT